LSACSPGVAKTRNARLQSLCETNLASLGGAFGQYVVENNGDLPSIGARTSFVEHPNREHLLPILRLRFIAPSGLVCPTSAVAAPANYAEMKDPQPFLADKRFRFYSPQNLNGPLPPVRLHVQMPMAGDPNPLFENQPAPIAGGQNMN
jgi:hypothetical protein